MPEKELLLYSLANTFNTTLNVGICDNTKAYLKSKSKSFSKLETSEKIYYTEYSIRLAQTLSDYLDEISFFELNTDSEHDIIHDFRLTWKNDNISYISMDHNTINIKDLIPEKLMKICKYKRNTNVCKAYIEEYYKINDHAYKKIKHKNKYSELDNELKNSVILEPICDLIMKTLSKKRKCASNLYNYLFFESDRIVFKLYKNRFTMYDFGKEMDNVESYRMKLNQGNQIMITFNNNTKFSLVLHTNASDIKQHISIKFHTTFKNMDELFAISHTSV